MNKLSIKNNSIYDKKYKINVFHLKIIFREN